MNLVDCECQMLSARLQKVILRSPYQGLAKCFRKNYTAPEPDVHQPRSTATQKKFCSLVKAKPSLFNFLLRLHRIVVLVDVVWWQRHGSIGGVLWW